MERFSKQLESKNNLSRGGARDERISRSNCEALVDDPSGVVVTEKTEGKTTVIELHVSDADMGKVIGKQGRIAKAIRSVVKAAAAKEDKKVVVDIAQ